MKQNLASPASILRVMLLICQESLILAQGARVVTERLVVCVCRQYLERLP